MARVEHVYLFDIDGTLVNAQGVGSRAFRRAVQILLRHELDWHGREVRVNAPWWFWNLFGEQAVFLLSRNKSGR